MATSPFTLKWGIMATGWIAESESQPPAISVSTHD